MLKIELGKEIFNDISLSKDSTQACATCHNKNNSFSDTRLNVSSQNNLPGAVPLGQDGKSLGDINVPSIAYASLIPEFHFDKEEKLFKGGLLLNGRAKNLTEQAKQPFLNPIEMQTTAAQVMTKIRVKYKTKMQAIYGDNIFDNIEQGFSAVADSIAAFEKTKVFSPFNSKFDQYLHGKVKLTALEALGEKIFKDEKKGNCAACHPVPTLKSNKQNSLFTDFSYDNLGVPTNHIVRNLNNKELNFIDNGLFDNPEIGDDNLKGAFRVSSLRNIAITAPYMHNGVFLDLQTVVHFYNTRDVVGAVNPQTHKPWQKAEMDATKNTEEMGDLKLTDKEEKALVAFLETLTDK